MKTQIHSEIPLHTTQMDKNLKFDNTKCSQGCETARTNNTSITGVSVRASLKNSSASSNKDENLHTVWLSNFIPGAIPCKSICMCTPEHSQECCNSPKLETMQMFINSITNKLLYIGTIGSYTTINVNRLQLFVTTQINLVNIKGARTKRIPEV